jgi:hypothetical protein
MWRTDARAGQALPQRVQRRRRPTRELDLETTGKAWFGDDVSLRWVLIHMVEETARHAGHVDIVRELIDGMVGDHGPA